MKVWRFARGGYGWFVVFIDEIGCVSIQSDYGDYAYRWSSFGDDIRTFLMQCNESYLIDKFTLGEPRISKGEKSIQRIKESILDERRQGDLSKEKARDLYDAVPEYLDDGFRLTDIADGDLVDWIVSGDYEMLVCEKEYGQVKAFFEGCWPDILKQMKESM
jgi:hypothetical protein